MTATAHALVAAAIVRAVPDPAVSLPLAFVSHFLLDIIPHWDFGTNWRARSKAETGLIAIVDTVIGFTLTYYIYHSSVDTIVLLAAMILGNLPDWLEAPYYIFFASQNRNGVSERASIAERIAYRIYKFENIFHTKAQFPFGLITQFGVVAFFMTLLR